MNGWTMSWRIKAAALLATMVLALPATARDIKIGAGVPGGIYSALAGSICRLVNADSERHGLRCITVPSPSVLNSAHDFAADKLDIVILQADIARDLVQGRGRFADRPFADARLLFHGHPEVLSIVARGGITDLDGLRGKTMDAGHPGSATRFLVDRMLADIGWPADMSPTFKALPIDQRWRAFCAGQLDAIAYVAGQPNGLVEETIAECEGQLVPLPMPTITRLVGQLPDYHSTEIPAGLYSKEQPAVPTVGVATLVLGSTRLSEGEGYEIVAAVLGGAETLRRMQPAFAGMQADDMIEQDDAVPQHPGAVKFAAGMLKQP